MIGLRPEFHLGKFGLGLDFTLLLDENGQIRKEDWDDWNDYLNKLYFISFGKRGDPFFFRFGGISSTTLGYGILINNYNNLREYPSIKRLGLDIGFETNAFGAQAFISDFNDLWAPVTGPLVGGRMFFRPVKPFQIGGSFAGDFNEYNGLRDSDKDGIPDRIDHYPHDAARKNEYDTFADVAGPTAADALVAAGLVRDNRGQFTPKKTESFFWAADAGLSIIKSDAFNLDLYAQFGQSLYSKGWGFTAPGVKVGIGDFMEITADYRQTDGGFLFGYFNDTYDLERASFTDSGGGVLGVKTKRERLNTKVPLYGYFGSLKVNLFNVITGSGQVQQLLSLNSSDQEISWRFGLGLQGGVIPKLAGAELHYIQNNITEWKFLSESTVLGATVGLDLGGATLNLQYDIICFDANGNGIIDIKNFTDETRMEFSILTKVSF
jgi:hypothetical protein